MIIYYQNVAWDRLGVQTLYALLKQREPVIRHNYCSHPFSFHFYLI